MKRALFAFAFLLFLSSCNKSQEINKQNARLIGNCEGCEAVFEYGDRNLTAVDTLPTFDREGQRIKVTGTIYKPDGKTPAEDVILYVYHTNQKGIYETRGDEKGWGKRHGFIRGWMKTGKDGKYTFYTIKPASYPDRETPAHIHPIILEPNGKYYWVGGYHFEGDPYLTEGETSPDSPRCGTNGLLSLRREGNLWVGERDFVLGKLK
jgi:protocatechuate 3,4-dioxygenase beta subunit